ncbi:MAG TPA: hypothetical protein VGH74_10735 [Planctomycetaceae bacterium]|jgi:hypothetical protein
MARASAWLFGSALLLFAAGPLWRVAAANDDDDASLAARESEETSRLIRAELPRWKLWSGDREHELTLNPKSVLRWTNPGVGRVYGDVYLWTRDGRPEAVMSFYKAWKPAWGFAGEMHSLSQTGLSADREGALRWQPTKAGIALNIVPGAERPAGSAPRRLQEMRTLAGQFSARMIDQRQNAEGERQELRLLTQPLYRYPAGEGEVLDGALFAIVLGTDPEVFLLLEARRASEKLTWQYGLARMNIDPMTVSYKDEEVWRVEKTVPWSGPIDKPYFVHIPRD